MSAVKTKPINVLLVEDDAGDVLMTREALIDGNIDSTLHVVDNGVDAMAFLRHEEPYQSVPRPDLVLLDLNLPRMDGREVLDAVKRDETLRRIPIVVLTTSESEDDIVKSYDLHANAFVTKPVDFSQFVDVVKHIDEFFVSVVKLPPR